MSAPSLVFVYGTLLTGEANHGLLARARLIAATRTPPAFALYDLGAFPGLVAGGSTSVVGELYEIDDATFAALDHLEDYPRYYQRQQIALDNGATAWTYLLSPAQVAEGSVIRSGDWRAHRAGDAAHRT
jgi:gamma-glutamylaminecyclotransferase